MSPDGYLNFAGIFVSYFLKVAIAYLLCLILGRLLTGPRQRFSVWLGFILGSLAYWVYVVTSFFSLPTFSATSFPTASYPASRITHQFLVPTKFRHPAMIFGRALGYVYVVGVLLLVSAGIWKRIKLHFLLRQGRAPSGELKNLFDEMCRNFGIRSELLILPKVSSPATVCWWRPRILLPQVCEQLGDSLAMADILSHELAHVARHDYFWSTINDLICRLLFFHPAVWQAKQQMHIHREMACDLTVVAARPEHRADYAYTLTQVARLCLSRKYPVIGIDFAAPASLLSHRVRAILNQPERSSWRTKFFRSVAGLALVGAFGFFCPVVSLVLAFAPSNQPPQAAPQLQTVAKPQVHLASRHRRKTVSPQESVITESPAYKLKSSPGWSSYEPEFPARSEESADERISSSGAGWKTPAPGSKSKSAGETVGSIIVATVGTIIDNDRAEDRSKRKDTSHFHAASY